ncbi:hypothetical protein RUM43_005124 [Polyplax serrata]|uniref:Uncharacterized protein n=1 Tax=Polyplax serrata TaxID=468196 RepID=A0AAN8XMK9_POLSC
MAGKKKEGVAGLKGTSGGLRRDDRLASSKSIFDMITIDARNAMTVIYMLQSPEDNIVLKAVASLEIYGERSEANLQLLSSLGILQFLLPLVRVSDTVIKRFSQKLIGLLCSLEEFREQMFKLDDVLVTFVDILEKRVYLRLEPDVVMHEFSALTLAELTKECEGASKLLKIDNCIPTLFLRITSSDPDIANHLLNDVFGIEHFIKCPYFDITRVLALVSSGYPAIQMLAIEVLLQLLSWHRDNTILFAFRDARGIESALEIMEKEEWSDLHTLALDLLTNVVDSTDLCESLLQTGCLVRFINLLETVDSGPFIEKILGVLGRMAQTQKGRMALHKLEAIPKFCYYLNARVDVVLQSCCMGLANMAQYALSLDSIVAENPFPQMLDILINGENDLDLRNTAAFALSVLATEERRVAEILLNLEKFETLYDILNDNNKSYPKELCSNIIQIFTGISAYEYLRTEIVTENFLIALINCIMSDGDSLGRGSSLEVDALECLCGYLTDQKAQFLFNKLGGPKKVFHCMKSRFAAVRDWAGQLVTVTSQNKDFVKAFIKIGGLDRQVVPVSHTCSIPLFV